MTEKVSDQANLPAMLAGASPGIRQRAAGALGSLVGKHFPEIMARAKAVEEERAARDALKEAFRSAAALQPELDLERAERVLNRTLDDAFAKQERREEVATRTVEHLNSDRQADEDPSVAPIDADWLNIYNGYAENASSESLQDMWARVLAGQIRKPGSISLKTLQFVSVLERETAEVAMRVLPWIVSKKWLAPGRGEVNFAFDDLALMRDSGLIGGMRVDSEVTVTMKEPVMFFRYKNTAVVAHGEVGSTFKFSTISSSKTFRELASIIPYEETAAAMAQFAAELKEQPSITGVDVGPYVLAEGKIIQPRAWLSSTWRRESPSAG